MTNYSIAILLTAGLLSTLFITALINIRPVGAEDDCAFNTYAVQRLPIVGLVCIGEGQ